MSVAPKLLAGFSHSRDVSRGDIGLYIVDGG
jgi:hypothetical protein